ncbi:hypothetical protein Ga0123462_0144 [Mariprofundus ferrinatatus]|uniref:EF-hand domain-containing protein n=1 Tax=Mariprofundus ferrinatatus TaxID=1921087 RepID=A0A2K8L1R2_9PROT|nr:hypothetical protein [Mariprofundus ferrinatatus]ATX81022.1 hypothetical protein Ga0123462_0144 [Mariprofundus ferrinatatus]
MKINTVLIATAFACLVAGQPGQAAGGLGIDARFDLTNDGIVDASDWQRMTEDAKRAYANESVKAMGEDPHAVLEGSETRGAHFLKALRSVYE